MNLCHLYGNGTDSMHIEKMLSSFDNSVSIDFTNIDSVGDYGIYIVEIGQITKELSEKVRTLFSATVNPLIYFLVPQKYNIMFFQLAFLLGVKTIITQRQDTDKVIAKIKSDFKYHKDNYLEHILGKSLIKSQDFLFFRDNKLIFVTPQLLKEFNCVELSDLEQKIFSQINIDNLLEKDKSSIKSIVNEDAKNLKYLIRSVSLNSKDEKVVSIEPYLDDSQNCNQLDFVSSRTSFIELLKDKVLEKSISEKKLSIITIQVENLKKLDNNLNKIETETIFKELLVYIESIIGDKLMFSQFNMEFYVALFEDISFEELKDKAKDFNMKLTEFISEQKYKPLITLFALDINDIELNDILITLENISQKKLTDKQIKNENLEYISNIQKDISEKEMIDIQLNSAYINGTEFKLLNIHKGLCINTSSKIIKKTEDSIYIKFEHLQGILMQNEKETVIQSSEYIKDIRATVKHVNMEKKFAILEKFQFLNTNANERKYSRVTCSARTPIVVSHPGVTLHGEVLDISINSIAINTKVSKGVSSVESKDVTLNLTLPLESHIDGFTKLTLKAKTLFTICNDESCKLIFELYEDSTAEAIIMEYVYSRQKDLIVEVKKMVINSNL